MEEVLIVRKRKGQMHEFIKSWKWESSDGYRGSEKECTERIYR